MENINILLIFIIVLALVAIYFLWVVAIFKGRKKDASELEITTKNGLEQVKRLYERGQYPLAELFAKEYLERIPNHQEVRVYLAKAYFMDNKYNNAIAQALKVLKKDSTNIETKKILGDCYIKKELLNKAIKEYEELFDLDNSDIKVVKTLADLYRDTEQNYSAVQVYQVLAELIEDKSTMADVQMTLATLNEEIHNYPAAFEAYKTRLEILPTDVVTNKKLTELYIRIKNNTKAIETLLYMMTFVNETKDLVWVYENIVDLYVQNKEYERAIEYSEKMLDIQGVDKFKIRNNIANYHIALNRYDEGIAILEELVMMSQNEYHVTIELAKSYIKCKEYAKALEQYLLVLDKATPKEAKNIQCLICELYIAWACNEAESENYDESYKYLTNAEQYNAINPEIYYQIANNKIKQKFYAESIEYLRRALDYDKTKESYPKMLLLLAEAHHQLGNFFEEKKALMDLLKIDEKNALGLYRVGLMYVAQHDIKTAEENFKKALECDPELIQAKYNLALICENNNKDKAKELYVEILEQDPSFVEAKNALTDLSSSEY